VLGLGEDMRLTFGAEEIVFLRAGSGWVELVADGGAARSAGVVDHLALRVDDVDAAMARLRTMGVTLLDEAPFDVADLPARILFCAGPDGERIELIERR
jgi:catechol 2,3-dioxygenase-like lactoylglutathione lyase family enzyme